MTPETIATALSELAARDADIARAVEAVGYPEPRNREQGFGTFLNIIIGQQVSVHAAAAIRGRLVEATQPLTPDSFLALDDDALRVVGLSRRKMEYSRLLAEDILSGAFSPDKLPELDDDQVMAEIIARKGLGRWSAEVYMLFALGRTDVWPADDLAVQVAVQRIKGLDERPNRATMDEIAEAWRPWRGIAALLFWHHYNTAAL
ncbi:MAG: DNA-3-methyladenine glycosylase 2 family protein [Rhodobacteraceae bacterium]|nr:DNA-3-methyladenine glycosylase 2 family protein [Paracoccaceae bacterium]